MAADNDLVQLQAIISSLPMHAVPRWTFRDYAATDMLAQCGGIKYRPPEVDQRSSADRVQDALQEARLDYPEFEDRLGNLQVVYASLDLVCLADHSRQMLFTGVRGTDRNMNMMTTPRDWTNNLGIALGTGPTPRCHTVQQQYEICRSEFAGYSSYCTGHSLGGAVAVHLAEAVESDPILRYSRVDVFNMGFSPLSRSFLLKDTELHVHVVQGDWASWGLSWRKAIKVHTHPEKPHISERHSLKHFLPTKARDRLLFAEDFLKGPPSQDEQPSKWLALLATMACVGARTKAQTRRDDVGQLGAAPERRRSLGFHSGDAPAAEEGMANEEGERRDAWLCTEGDGEPDEDDLQYHTAVPPVHWPAPSPLTSPRGSALGQHPWAHALRSLPPEPPQALES
mmetsp:Transcript_121907/g.352024  ORF Transcript_121907/g.352024 Transcript_121907/m.352024 type:complete len:397 (-) Transcript_121907:125-1315(-)